MALTTDLWRECSRPISDFRDFEDGLDDEAFAQHDLVGQRHQMFLMLRRMLVMRCRPRCQSLWDSSRPM